MTPHHWRPAADLATHACRGVWALRWPSGSVDLIIASDAAELRDGAIDGEHYRYIGPHPDDTPVAPRQSGPERWQVWAGGYDPSGAIQHPDDNVRWIGDAPVPDPIAPPDGFVAVGPWRLAKSHTPAGFLLWERPLARAEVTP